MRASRVWIGADLSTEDKLNLFESRDYIEDHYKWLHGGEVNAGKANEIIAHVSQGREYFESARTAGILARPLLQYYGVLAFARAAILLLSRTGLRESALSPAHGLSLGSRPEAGGRSEGLTAIQLEGSRGTFSELLDAVRYGDWIELDLGNFEAPIVHTPNLTSAAVGFSITFGDLLSRIPEIGPQYAAAIRKPPNYWRLRTRVQGQAGCLIEVNASEGQLPTETDLKSWMMLDDDIQLDITEVVYSRIGPVPVIRFYLGLAAVEKHFANIRATHLYDPCLIRPYPSQPLPSIASAFTAAYTLGMLVRYFPSRWSRLSSAEPGDAAWPVVRALSGFVDGFPEQFLSVVSHKREREGADDS